LREVLLRRILAKIPSLPPAVAGRLAGAAAKEHSEGKLLTLACDAWDIPISRVARSAGVPDVDVSRFVAGLWQPGERERALLVSAIACTMAEDGH
jgi:hypothetical protein